MSSEIQNLKNKLRLDMLQSRRMLSKSYKSNYDSEITELLLSIIEAKKWTRIHVYISMNDELSTLDLIQKLLVKSILVVCPKTLSNRQLEHRILIDINEIELGIKGTIHPKNQLTYTGDYDLIVVPGLAFDDFNFRLGYGAGYYDTFLQQQPNAFKIALAYPFQKIAKVPVETHDVPIDQVLIL